MANELAMTLMVIAECDKCRMGFIYVNPECRTCTLAKRERGVDPKDWKICGGSIVLLKQPYPLHGTRQSPQPT